MEVLVKRGEDGEHRRGQEAATVISLIFAGRRRVTSRTVVGIEAVSAGLTG
jgi:hypothetical protein